MDSQHPLYYHCRYEKNSSERYGLLRQRDNSFYIIDHDPILLKNVQLLMSKYEFLYFVNIDHFFTFLPKTNDIVKKANIESLTEHHNFHVSKAAIHMNDETRINDIQKKINNDNCYLFGMTLSSARSLPVDVNHFRLTDNIVQHKKKNKIFDEEIQEKLFLLRRLTYVLKHTLNYLTNFIFLQENITEMGLNVSKEFFNVCNPHDSDIPNLIKKELEIDSVRINSIKYYHDALFKILNDIDLQQTINDFLSEFKSKISKQVIVGYQAKKYYLDYHPHYDMKRTTDILTKEIENILKHYE